ncbi:MAG TPA: hypothetical protein VKQ32_27470, partial [Polyangia bacterium]|nr:hypothetical protein [Polyangia bacterium]
AGATGGSGGTAGSTGGSAAGSGGSTGGATAGSGGSGGATGGSGGATGGTGGSVACTDASTCPGGADTECQHKTCVNSLCGLNFTAANTPVTSQTAGDCKQNVCDGLGGVMAAILDSDTPADDGNACTSETCVSGTPTHAAEPARTPCAQGGGTLCNGNSSAPACVVCVAATDCPGTDMICRKRVCGNQYTCGFSNSPAGTAAEPDATGNCQKAVCDDMGGVTSVADNTDVPTDDGNSCTDDVCSNGTPSHPAKAQGTACTQSAAPGVCNGTSCVQCLVAGDCPGSNTVCRTITCDGSHTCGHMDQPQGTAAGTDATGNCKKSVCDGAGAIASVPDDTDLPVDGNPCTKDVCTNGTVSNPDLPAGTICSTAPETSMACDGSGVCNTVTFRVVRVGTGAAALSSMASAVFVEERSASGTLVGTPVALPTAAAGSNHMLTMSGSASSEGCLSLSADGHYLAVAGYDAATGTAGVASGTSNRVAGRIDIAGTVDTSTVFSTTALGGNNARGATTTDGSELWLSGAGNPSANGGVWYNTLGAAGTETHVLSSPNNVRCVSIFGSQLYGSSGSGASANVFSIGFGTPTAASQTATSLMTATGSPNGFAMFDLSNTISGLDTMYVADDAAGLQKWTLVPSDGGSGTTWILATTLNITGNTGFRGVAGYVAGGVVTLMASTAESSPNRLVVFVNDGAGSVVATAPTNEIFRGVAVSPHFPAP